MYFGLQNSSISVFQIFVVSKDMYILQTSNTVAVALNLLAQNPAVQEKIRKEVDGIDRSGSFTLEDVKSMSYIKAFTKELLRYGNSMSCTLHIIICGTNT